MPLLTTARLQVAGVIATAGPSTFAGTNTFASNITLSSGTFSMPAGTSFSVTPNVTLSGTVTLNRSDNGNGSSFFVNNTNTGTTARSVVFLGQNLTTEFAFFEKWSSGTTGGGIVQPSRATFRNVGSGGIAIGADHVNGAFSVYTGGAGAANLRFVWYNNGDSVPGTGALATSAAAGHQYSLTCAGPPTGSPSAYTGRAAWIVDTTNNRLYIHIGGAWRYTALI